MCGTCYQLSRLGRLDPGDRLIDRGPLTGDAEMADDEEGS
jgi:hypothetical protein